MLLASSRRGTGVLGIALVVAVLVPAHARAQAAPRPDAPTRTAPSEGIAASGSREATDASTTTSERASEPSSTPALGPEPGSTTVVIRTVVGLVVLLGLAYLGAHRRVRRWEERLGIWQLLTTGLPFVALGLIARSPGVAILTPEVVDDLSPLLQLGLGWIGFLTGFSFRLSVLEEPPRGGPAVVLALTGAPLLFIATTCGAILYEFRADLDPWVVVRAAFLIGLAGSLAAPSMSAAVERAGADVEAAEDARRMAKFETLAAVVGLALFGAYDRPRTAHVGWTLPGTGWLFVLLGVAATLGVLGWWMMHRPMPRTDSRTLLLGIVAFGAGIAGYLQLSALVICFLAGITLRNLPGAHYRSVVSALERFERPVYLVFLAIAGAIWDVADWRGWALLVPFVLARIAGRWLGLLIARRLRLRAGAPGVFGRGGAALILAPMSPLSIAIIVSASTLYASTGARLIVTPVIVGAVILELAVHLVARHPAQEPA